VRARARLAAALVVAAALAPATARADDDTAQAHYDKGAALVQEKKLDEAEKEFEKAVALDPKHVEAQRLLATLLLKKDGKPEAAAKHLEAALAADPENEKVLAEMANAYATAAERVAADPSGSAKKRNDLATKAADAYKKLLEKQPDLAGALFNLGSMQTILEKWPDAIATFESYAEKAPDDARGKFYLAQAYDKGGAPKEKAIGAYADFVTAAGSDAKLKKDVERAKRRILELKGEVKKVGG
jgi:tetratricopeptide (TPR) repeat protein